MRKFRCVFSLAFLIAILFLSVPDGAAQGAPPMQGSPLMGGVPTGAVSAQPLLLSLSDAIDRALRYNLATLSGAQDEREAAAMRSRSLSDLLPKVQAGISGMEEQLSLAAFGFSNFPGFPSVVGPFSVVDGRLFVSSQVYDRKLIHDLRESEQNQQAVSFGNANTRELVVLVVADLYLQALADSSRISAVEAQVNRAQALFDRATDMKNNGVIAGIDLLRAQVELQSEQQRLLAVRNEFAQQKLNLQRAIGVPLGQEVQLTGVMPQEGLPGATLDAALQSAMANRSDAKSAQAQIRAAEEALNSAKSENSPSISVNADFGDIGQNPASSHETFTLRGAVNIPIFNANHSKSDRDAAQARLTRQHLQFEDLKARIELDVRSAFLDLQSSQDQVKVAQSSLDLAHKQLDQAQDRFESGVADNLEVVQAQEAVALADESLISSLFSMNVAKASLARAMGVAEQSIKTFLGGKQ